MLPSKTRKRVSASKATRKPAPATPQLVPEFERMKKLAVLMNKRREERGSIDFDLPEPVIEFDEHGQMRGVTKAERTWANRLIEEFMLAANECVAVWLEDLGVPSLYRIHEKPDPRRVVQFEELAAAFGYSLGLGPLPVKRIQTRQERRESHGQGRNPRQHEVPEDIAVTPRMYQKLAARIEGRPEERILSYLMLRSLSQARYSEVNEGHFALAAPSYTHFTSPIRRYPDLIVHRIAKTLLRAGVPGDRAVTASRLSSPWSHPNEGRPATGVAPSFPRSVRKGWETTRVPHPSSARVGGPPRNWESQLSASRSHPPSPNPSSPRSPKKRATPSAVPPKQNVSWSSGKKFASCRTASATNSQPSSSTPLNSASLLSSPISLSRGLSLSTQCAPTASPGARTRMKSSASDRAAATAQGIACK